MEVEDCHEAAFASQSKMTGVLGYLKKISINELDIYNEFLDMKAAQAIFFSATKAFKK